jgi:hypothetical protein
LTAPHEDSAFVDEVLRINQRYVSEIVEGFDVCPFARGARTGGAFGRRVIVEATRDPAPSLAAIDALAADPALEVAVLIYPRVRLGASDFDDFVRLLRQADEARRRPPFALAMFHPDATYGTESPERMVMFFRKTPDPTIQLVRFDVLDAVKRGQGGKFLFEWSAEGWAELMRRTETPSVSDRITRDNFAMVMREGIARLEGIYADIRADRDRSYARFDRPSGLSG